MAEKGEGQASTDRGSGRCSWPVRRNKQRLPTRKDELDQNMKLLMKQKTWISYAALLNVQGKKSKHKNMSLVRLLYL